MSDYWETVEAIAREIIENNGTDEQNWHDSIHENVDGNEYIIYYGKNEEVLDQTHNEPDNSDVASMCKPDGNWQDMRMTAAYLAMEGDVWEKLRELVDEYNPEYFLLRKVSNKQYLTGIDFKSNYRDEEDELLDSDEEILEDTYTDNEPKEGKLPEEVRFDDKDTADEVKEAWETKFKDELEVVAFNDDDKEIPLVNE